MDAKLYNYACVESGRLGCSCFVSVRRPAFWLMLFQFADVPFGLSFAVEQKKAGRSFSVPAQAALLGCLPAPPPPPVALLWGGHSSDVGASPACAGQRLRSEMTNNVFGGIFIVFLFDFPNMAKRMHLAWRRVPIRALA